VSAAIALIVVSALGAGVVIARHMREVIIRGNAETVATGASSLATLCLDELLAADGPEGADCAQLDHALEQRREGGLLYGYRLLGPDGTVLYSTEPAEVGERLTVEGLDDAMSGEVVVAAANPHDDPLLARPDENALRVLAPVRRGGDGPVIAVAESLKPFAPISDSVHESQLLIWFAVGLGAVVTIGTIAFIGIRALRELAESDRRVQSLNDRLQSSLLDIEAQSLGVLQSLSATVDARDRYTARHSLGTTEVAHRIGKSLGLSRGQLGTLERAALLHDVGKIGVPEALLLKQGSLTAEEFDRVKEHSEVGARILETIPFLADIVPVVRHHHERWDGGGYPDGVTGENIPLLARVLAVADAFDAMVSERPYRAPVRRESAIAEVERCAGTQFDPAVVEAFMKCVGGRSD